MDFKTAVIRLVVLAGIGLVRNFRERVLCEINNIREQQRKEKGKKVPVLRILK